MIVTDATNSAPETKLRLIDREEWARLNRHNFPLHSVHYIDFCTVPLSAPEAMAKLREAGYVHLGVLDDIVYIAIKSHPDLDDDICRDLAHEIFEVESRIVHVHPASSQAGLASIAR